MALLALGSRRHVRLRRLLSAKQAERTRYATESTPADFKLTQCRPVAGLTLVRGVVRVALMRRRAMKKFTILASAVAAWAVVCAAIYMGVVLLMMMGSWL